MAERRRARGPGRGINGGRENDGGRVVRQQYSDYGADRVDQREQPLRRAGRASLRAIWPVPVVTIEPA
jgi:hypothetical protein